MSDIATETVPTKKLLYPRLADLPGAKPIRRIYLGGGYIPPIPTPDASDEKLLAFARACADPWNQQVVEDYLSHCNTPEYVAIKERAEGCVMFVALHTDTNGYSMFDGYGMECPPDLVEQANALFKGGKR